MTEETNDTSSPEGVVDNVDPPEKPSKVLSTYVDEIH